MCDKKAFAKLRAENAENRRMIAELAKTDAVQSEQIKTLFNTTKTIGDTQRTLINRVLAVVLLVLVILVLAIVFGAIGERGFNGVTNAVPNIVTQN